MPKKKDGFQPKDSQIAAAGEDVAWEYLCVHLAALEMTKGHPHPVNHLVEQAFLVHVRSMAEFFWNGVAAFRLSPNSAPISRTKDDVYAVDFCSDVRWCERHFGRHKFGDTELIKVINKTLSHMTYSRRLDREIGDAFVGYLHVDGTVKLMRRTWEKFLESISPRFRRPECTQDIEYWIHWHSKEWPLKLPQIESEFERRSQELSQREPPSEWTLNQTPDGPLEP
jgi:hypothetical protein